MAHEHLDTPDIASTVASAMVFGLDSLSGPVGLPGPAGPAGVFGAHAGEGPIGSRRIVPSVTPRPNVSPTQVYEEYMAQNMPRRLVKVLIIDPNENVPLDQCLIYRGDEKLTDATDQELFFEIDIKKLLEDHNKDRVKLVDKSVKERTEHLEPAKIRDLKMVVVTVAQF